MLGGRWPERARQVVQPIATAIYQLTLDEYHRLSDKTSPQGEQRRQIVTQTLSQCYRLGIGVAANMEESYRLSMEAAMLGVTQAKYRVTLRRVLSGYRVPHNENGMVQQHVEWIIDSLLLHLHPNTRVKLRAALITSIPHDIAREYFPEAMKCLYGKRHRYIPKPYISDIACEVRDDNREGIADLLSNWRDKFSSDEIKKLVLEVFLMAVVSRAYKVLREVILCSELDHASLFVTQAFSDAVKSGDEELFYIFFEGGLPLSCLQHESFALAGITCRSVSFINTLRDIKLSYDFYHALQHGREESPFNPGGSQPTSSDTEEVARHGMLTNPLPPLGSQIGAEASTTHRDIHGNGQTEGPPKMICHGNPWASMIHYSIVGENWPGFCELLHGSGRDQLEARWIWGQTTLQAAVCQCQPLFVAALIAQGADTGPVAGELFSIPERPSNVSLLHLACRHAIQVGRLSGLIRFETDEECRFDHPAGEHKVDEPTLNCWKVMICVLLNAGLDINAVDSHAMTPIRYLLRRGSEVPSLIERLQFLHQNGARLDIPAQDGSYPVHTCSINRSIPTEAEDFIIANTPRDIIDAGTAIGANPSTSAPYQREYSPLANASFFGRQEICRKLIRRGARITSKTCIEFNHHIYQSSDGALWALQTTFPPPDGPTGTIFVDYVQNYMPLLQAEQITMYMECVNPHLNSADIVGRTRLHLAVQERDLDAVMGLLKPGVFLSRRDWLGFTALHLAHAAESEEVIRVLEKAKAEGPEEKSMRDMLGEVERVEAPPPAELGELFRREVGLWDRLLRAYQQEMERRADLWPGEHFVGGADCLVQADFREVLGLEVGRGT